MSITTRRSLAGTALLLILAGLLAVVPASGAPDEELLPDLVAEPVGDPDTVAGTDTVAGQTRLLLRFTGYIRNAGAGPLRVTGVNPVDKRINGDDLHQVVTHADGSLHPELRPGAELLYETTDLHDHWHFQKAARYSLFNDAQTQETGASNKVGFCFLDVQTFGEGFPAAPRTFDGDCLRRQPAFAAGTQLEMGVSPGWRDVYTKDLPFQYVDVSNTSPGRYWLHSEIDPYNLLREADEQNTGAFAAHGSTVQGYVAKPASGVPVSGVDPSSSTVTLSADSFDPQGAVQYKIVEEPRHGQLSRSAADGWFSESQLSYLSDGAYSGCDRFRFAARQAGSQFPLSPGSAAVTLHVGGGDCVGTVSISGAPEFLFTGDGAQLSAAVSSGPEAVTWKVGGNSELGTVSGDGFYRAPASVPEGGKVRVTAVAGNGHSDEVEIAIRPRPRTGATPDLPSPSVPAARHKPLSKPVIGRNGRLLVVKFMPGRTGRLKVNVNRPQKGKPRRIASCNVHVVRARSVTCRFELRKAKVRRLRGRIAVYATLTAKGRRVATRRATVSLVTKGNASYVGPICILTR